MDGIKNKFKILQDAFANTAAQCVSPLSLCLSFLGIITLRVFEEKFLAFSASPWNDVWTEFMHNFFFFSITLLLIWIIVGLFLHKKPVDTINLILWASFLILLPPLFDMAKTGGNVFWSFYLLNGLGGLGLQFVTVFGHLPPGIVYFGTRITFLLAVFFVAVIICIKTKSVWKTVFSALSTYIILFMMGSFPSWFVFLNYLLQGKNVTEVTGVKVAQFFGSPVQLFGLENASFKYAFAYQLGFIYYIVLVLLAGGIFFINNRQKFLAMARNARIPQLIYHVGLLGLGFALGFWSYSDNLQYNLFSFSLVIVVGISVCLAWLASVVVNDMYDYKIDIISNSNRPLQKKIFTMDEYRQLGIVLFIFSIIGGLTINITCASLLLVYQILAWFYSAPPYRLKRLPLIATFFSALASIVILFLGFSIFSGDEKLALFPWRIALMLLVGLTMSLPIKDFRDMEGDRKDGVLTIPVLFGSEIGRIVVGSGIFISFVMSVFLLNETRLFWWAVMSGGASFWMMNATSWKKKIKDKYLVWYILAVVAVYAIIMVNILFIGGINQDR